MGVFSRATGEAIPLRGLEGVPGLRGAPQDEAGLMRKFETPPGSQASSRGEAKDSALLPSRDADLLIATGEAIPLRGLEGVPGLRGAPQDEAGLTRKFETSHVGGATCRTPPIPSISYLISALFFFLKIFFILYWSMAN